MDRKILRNRLKYRTNRQFLAWAKTKYPNQDLHHLVGSRIGKKGKLNDLLVCPKTHEQHLREHSLGSDFDEDMLSALELLFDYVEYLQKQLDF